jgi:Flp pilus assembly protein TadD
MATATGTGTSESEAFDEGVKALNAGELDRALGIVAPFVERKTRNFGLWNLHGLILRALDRREEAIASLRVAARLAPTSAKIAHALARTLFEAGLPSVDAYGKALRLAPTDTEILAGLTSAFVVDGEPQTALSGLERILARSPQWIDGHALLTKLRWAQGDRERFARSFESAVQALPHNIDLWREWIIALMHADRWDEVLSVIARGRAAVGEHPVFAANEAIAYAETGNSKRAEALFAPLADIEDDTVQLRRVRHYLRWGRPADATAIIDEWVQRPQGVMFWPYASVAWRMLDDPRWEWLEGDDRFVGVYDIADRLPPLDLLADKLRNLHTLTGQPLEQSLRGGTQTEGDIFMQVDPVLVQLREAIRSTVAEHAAQLPEQDEAHPLLRARRSPIKFSGAWSVWLKEGGFHANHVHPAGWLSSALYIVLPPDLGTDEAGFLTLGDPSAPSFQIDMPPFRTIEPKPGRLALFPSYMWHGTRPFGEGERITVAFDVAVPDGR